MRRLVNNIFSVCFTFVRLCIYKLIHRGRLQFFLIERISPNVVLEFNIGSNIFLGKKVRIHSGCKIKTIKKSTLKIGDNVKINYNCIIACHDSITIGNGTEFGPAVYLYDHDHDYRIGLGKGNYKTSPIIIGDRCWIGANTVILRGTILGEGCVVGAGCVVSGEYPPGSRIVQKRITDVDCIDYSMKDELGEIR